MYTPICVPHKLPSPRALYVLSAAHESLKQSSPLTCMVTLCFEVFTSSHYVDLYENKILLALYENGAIIFGKHFSSFLKNRNIY